MGLEILRMHTVHLLVLKGRMGFKTLHRFFGRAFGMVSSLHS
jgi:hypothetical protein